MRYTGDYADDEYVLRSISNPNGSDEMGLAWIRDYLSFKERTVGITHNSEWEKHRKMNQLLFIAVFVFHLYLNVITLSSLMKKEAISSPIV